MVTSENVSECFDAPRPLGRSVHFPAAGLERGAGRERRAAFLLRARFQR